jgi:hypothetical protein
VKNIIILIFLLILTKDNFSQNVSGTWEGDLGGSEYLQVNIIQVGKNLCGYTYDYQYRNKQDHCKAYCNGSYNSNTKTIFLDGYSFMENSGSHVLIQLRVEIFSDITGQYMKGLCRTKASLFMDAGDPEEILLKKKSNNPTTITQTMRDCVETYKAAKKEELKEIKKKPNNKPPTKKIQPPKKELPVIAPKLKKDSNTSTKPILKLDTTKKINKNTTINDLPKVEKRAIKTNGRLNKEMSRIIVNDKKIKLELYDNGDIDGDTVSIFYNGRKIVSNKRLSLTPVIVNLDLDENTNMHSIILYAENLGSIPPNTALIIVTTPSGKRYELRSSANLEQNAELLFEYKPK